MPEQNSIVELICELGPFDDDIQVIQQAGDNGWVVAYTDDTVVEIQYDDADGKVTLMTFVGNLDDVSRSSDKDDPGLDEEEFLTMLLNYNFLWRDSGGIRMAMDGPDRNVVMLLDVFDSDLNLGTFAGILGHFVEVADAWRESFFGDDRPVPSSDEPTHVTPEMRV